MPAVKIYIDRGEIAANRPAIVVEIGDEEPVFCSEVRGGTFLIKQDFTRMIKPVVWIEEYTGAIVMETSTPSDAVMITDPPRVRHLVK